MNNTVNLSQYNKNDFSFGASIFKRAFWYFISGVVFENNWVHLVKLKIWLLNQFGAVVGPNCVIKPNIKIKHPWKLVVGDYSWIGEGVWIDNVYAVKIGSNVCISQGVRIVSGNHSSTDRNFSLQPNIIEIQDGVWLCAHSIVGPSVVCYSHSVLTLGSVATESLEPYFIYSGCRAKKIRMRVVK